MAGEVVFPVQGWRVMMSRLPVHRAALPSPRWTSRSTISTRSQSPSSRAIGYWITRGSVAAITGAGR